MKPPPPSSKFLCFVILSSVKLSVKFPHFYPFLPPPPICKCHKFSFLTPPGGTELLHVELRFSVCQKTTPFNCD